MSVREWFFSQVEKTETCWVWIGSIAEKRGGYGYFYDADAKLKRRAHHYLVDKLPAGKPKMEYDHLCRNVKCVRPEHLEMITAAENRRRQLDSDEVCRARLAESMRKKKRRNMLTNTTEFGSI